MCPSDYCRFASLSVSAMIARSITVILHSHIENLSLEGEGQMEPCFDDVEAALTEAQLAGACLEDDGVGDQHSTAGSRKEAPGRGHDGQKVGGQHLSAVGPDELVEPADFGEGHQAAAIGHR